MKKSLRTAEREVTDDPTARCALCQTLLARVDGTLMCPVVTCPAHRAKL